MAATKVRFVNGKHCKWERRKILHGEENHNEEITAYFFICEPIPGSKCDNNRTCKPQYEGGKEVDVHTCTCDGKDNSGYIELRDSEKCKWKETKNEDGEWEWECKPDGCKLGCATSFTFQQIFIKEGEGWSPGIKRYYYKCECE